ncbi:ABC transporter permease [Bacillus sp. 3103sda1]|uniref:ABC transporter permease n=1 Tax=Bacillus sp. 3103sda1 TaxID=2953808 RepID=UPI0020A0B358|nr:ABC transporter permease [Bacillus sp. 3103sda1]MCP1126079.1 ABC transporter permease [Bacillus sp. 3103sda1]
MNALKTIIKEHFESFYLIRRLSHYELKQAYAGNFLGILWVFLNPFTQIGVYWLVFGLGIRGGAPVNGVPYFVWLVCGLIPWFFISASILQGSNSIYARLNTVSKMNFPLSIVPTYVVISQLYTHCILVVFMLIISFINQGWHTINIFALLYGMFSVTIFLVALGFITSTLSTMLRDIHLLIQTATRMLFFLTPVFWEPKENMPQAFLFLVKINPFYYILEIYRDAVAYGQSSIIFSGYTLYFWGMVIVLFVIGSMLHIKFRKQFVDYL